MLFSKNRVLLEQPRFFHRHGAATPDAQRVGTVGMEVAPEAEPQVGIPLTACTEALCQPMDVEDPNTGLWTPGDKLWTKVSHSRGTAATDSVAPGRRSPVVALACDRATAEPHRRGSSPHSEPTQTSWFR